jgi:hypothetical protein
MMKKITRNKLYSFLIFALVTVTTTVICAEDPENEQAVTGRELLADCEPGATVSSPNQACMKYVFGLVQTVEMLQQMDPDQNRMFCIDPAMVSLQEVTTGVTVWLRAVPERLDEDAYLLVSEALNASYPCTANDVI